MQIKQFDNEYGFINRRLPVEKSVIQTRKIGIIETTSSKLTIYTCPMHPEIIKNKPGTCEKCGMDLVEKLTKKI